MVFACAAPACLQKGESVGRCAACLLPETGILKPLAVGFDATMAGIFEAERTGVFHYQDQLLTEAIAQAPDVQWTLFFSLPHPRHRSAISRFAEQVSASTPTRVVRGWMPLRLLRRLPLPVEAFTGSLDLFHSPAHLMLRSRAPGVVTIHDVAYLHDRSAAVPAAQLNHEEWRGWQLRRRFFAEIATQTADTVQRAAHVITVSEATRNAVLREFGLAADKVTAIPLGLRPGLHARPSLETALAWRTRLGLPPRYLLYVGTLDPNKNLDTLLTGFAHYRRRGGHAKLLLAGRSVFYRRHLEVLARSLQLGESVRFLGRVDDAALPVLYHGADAVVMPSPLEGFGLPALEAMACGTPVIVADAGALPEVVGSAALRVAAEDASAFGDAMLSLQEDAALVVRLREAGPVQARAFDWRRTAAQTLAVYRKVAGRSS